MLKKWEEFGEKIDMSQVNMEPLSLEPEAEPTGLWIRYRGEAERYTQWMGGRRSDSRRKTGPIVLEFTNQKTTAGIVEFVGKYGVPLKWEGWPKGEVPLENILENQVHLRTMWAIYATGDHKVAVTLFRRFSKYLADFKPQLTLGEDETLPVLSLLATNLYGFMALEMAAIMAGGVRPMRCEHCGNLFVTGAHTGRRKTAQYCAPRCRVAADRARKTREERSVKRIAAATPSSKHVPNRGSRKRSAPAVKVSRRR